MKTSLRSLNLSLLLTAVLASSAHGLARLWDGTLSLDTTIGARYDSEINARGDGLDDTIYSLRSGLYFRRSSPAFDFAAALGITAERYQDNSQFDDENWFFDLNLSPSAEAGSDRFRFSADLILESSTRSDEELGAIITSRTYGASAGLIYQANRHNSLTFDLSASREDPDSNRFNEIDTYGASVVYNRLLNKDYSLDLGSTYEKTDSSGESALDNETLAAFVGLQGQLLPKLNGSVRLGMQNRSTEGTGDDTSPYASANLLWTVDQTNQINASFSHTFSTNVGGQNSETTAASIAWNRDFNRRLSGSLGIDYTDTTLESIAGFSRDTEQAAVFASLAYEINQAVNVVADFRYSDQSSSDPIFEYDRLQTGLSLNLRW